MSGFVVPLISVSLSLSGEFQTYQRGEQMSEREREREHSSRVSAYGSDRRSLKKHGKRKKKKRRFSRGRLDGFPSRGDSRQEGTRVGSRGRDGSHAY